MNTAQQSIEQHEAGALSGLKVIELTQVLAGPYCGYQLAILGADVIKIELPASPDCSRGRGPIPELNSQGLGLTYQVQGGNKRSLALDIGTKEGKAILLQLISDCDILVENYRSGFMKLNGLGFGELSKVNPRLVYCSMTGYGDSGSRSSKGAYDNTIQATSGIIDQCRGQKPAVSFVDYAAGSSAAFAILAAVIQRSRTGKGCYISTSMLEVALTMMAPEAAAVLHAPEAEKAAEAGILSYDTRDGRIVLGAFKPSQYRKLGKCLKDHGYDIALLEAINNWEDVRANTETLKALLEPVFLDRDNSQWLTLLDKAEIPAEPIISLADAVKISISDERQYFDRSAEDELMLPTAAFQMSSGGPELHTSPPSLGEDTATILSELGFEDRIIKEYLKKGVVQ
ncbi:MAG: crotonobetainyl-CoA:carnitine CoA-transferase CaiB-like acyl-CoA transferase [Kiritimatiellia bacterium]